MRRKQFSAGFQHFANLGDLRRPVHGRGSMAFSPRMLQPTAWYDVHLGGTSTTIVDRSGTGKADATFGAAGAAPLYLPYATPAVYLPGLSGNYVWCADSAALSFDNDIEVVMRVRCTDWTSGAGQTLVGQYVTATNDRRFRFYVSGTGDIGLSASEDGTSGTVRTATITPTSALTDDTWQWLRMRFQRSNGSNCVGTLDIAADTGSNSVLPSSWTANGTNTGTICSGLANTSAPLELGTFAGGTLERFAGQIGRMIYKAGIDGSTVADFNADACTQTGFTDAYSNAWTVARATTGRKTVVQSPAAKSTRGLCLLGTDDYIDVPAAAVPALDTFASASSVVVVFRRWHNPGTAGHAIFATKASVANTVLGSALRLVTAAGSTGLAVFTGDGTASDGSNITSGTALGARCVVAMTVGNSAPFVTAASNGGTSATDSTRTTTGSTSTGAAGRIGAFTGGSGVIDMELEALLAFDRSLTPAELAALTVYYRGGA